LCRAGHNCTPARDDSLRRFHTEPYPPLVPSTETGTIAHRVPSKTPAHAHTSHTRAYALPWRYAQNCACRNFDYTQPGQLHFMAVQALILWSVQEEDLESIRATTGVRATVGGKRSGEAALWHTYAMLALPTLLLAAPEFSPTRWSAAATLTPREMPT